MRIYTVKHIPSRQFIITAFEKDNPSKMDLVSLLDVDVSDLKNVEIRVVYKTDDKEELHDELSNFAKKYENNNYFLGTNLPKKPTKNKKTSSSSKKVEKKTSTYKSRSKKSSTEEE